MLYGCMLSSFKDVSKLALKCKDIHVNTMLELGHGRNFRL